MTAAILVLLRQEKYLKKIAALPPTIKMRLADGLLYDVPRGLLPIDYSSATPKDYKVKRRRVRRPFVPEIIE